MSQTGALLLGLAAVAYYVSLLLHPYTKCRPCRGSGTHRGAVLAYGFRDCHVCSGKGQKQRAGAAVFGIGTPRRSQSRTERPFGRRRR